MPVQDVDSQWNPYPYDDTLPDVSDVTFDHKDKNGNNVKFMWGVATSSYQVEGNILTNDWDAFTNMGDINSHVNELAAKWFGQVTLKLESPGSAVDHWNLNIFSQDLQRAKLLGINAYRLSLEWSRIQPKNSSDFDLDAINHYREMITLILQNGMIPILTLNHVTLPKWVLTPPRFTLLLDEDFEMSLKGWETCDTVNAFVKFVKFVVPKFMDLVKYWITINEPVGSVMGAGYLAGVWSPGFNVLTEFLKESNAKNVLFNLIDAHVRAYDAIKSLAGDESKVGIAHAMVFPKVFNEPGDFKKNMEAAIQWDYCFNQFFLDAVIDGIENRDVIHNNKNVIIRDDWKKKLDFVGINYYRSVYIKSIFPYVPWFGGFFDEDLKTNTTSQHNELNDLGWEIY
ncbi:MAG: family 1 glycosylhydrolase, partial [Nitrosotalea sp.]